MRKTKMNIAFAPKNLEKLLMKITAQIKMNHRLLKKFS